MYGMSRVVEKSNIQNCVNSTGNCVHYMYGMSGLAKNLNTQNCINSTVYLVRKCRECLDFQKISMSITAKFNKKLCTLYMYGMFEFAKKIEYLELRKFNCKLYKLYVRNIWICRKFEYPELHKFYGKLCTFYVWNVQFCRKLNIQICENSTRNCLHYICTVGLDLQKN